MINILKNYEDMIAELQGILAELGEEVVEL
jgi:hypothetical protein